VCGLSSVLDLTAFNELFPHALADNAYYKCLCDVISTLIIMVRDWNSKTPNEPLTLEFTFDRRRQSDGNAGSLYSMLINLPEWEGASIFDTKITFDCRTNPRIQMADLLARETMKEFDRRFNKPGDPPRKQFQILEAKDKFRFLERDREYCKEWLSKMESLQAENGMSEKDYFEWLAQKGRVQNGKPHDNWRNRIQYFSWKETQPNLTPVFKKAQKSDLS
jgi:hypothetical protein